MADYEALAKNTVLRNRYKIKRPLAEGGMGAIYLAIDQTFNEPVAIKENFVQTGPGVDREASMRQFREEAGVLRRLKNDRLPNVIDLFTVEERQYLVIDFIAGKNLWEIIEQQNSPLAEQDALDYIIQVCEAVIYLHSQKPPVVHRDIKSQNIIITPQDQVYTSHGHRFNFFNIFESLKIQGK